MFRYVSPNSVKAERVISLDELMRYIPVSVLYELSSLFAASEAECRRAMDAEGASAGSTPLKDGLRQKWLPTFERARDSKPLAAMLPFAMDTIARLLAALQTPETTVWQMGELLRDLERRIVDELSKQVHFQIDPWAVGLVLKPTKDWESAIAKFAPIERDVIEASWCLACDRSTASVFHLMRVMEFGLDKLRRMTRVPKRRPGWDGLIEAIDRKHLAPKPGAKKSPAKRKKDRFIADAVLAFRSVKEARNTTMHDYEKVYTPNQAADIYTTVRSFMLKMAEVS